MHATPWWSIWAGPGEGDGPGAWAAVAGSARLRDTRARNRRGRTDPFMACTPTLAAFRAGTDSSVRSSEREGDRRAPSTLICCTATLRQAPRHVNRTLVYRPAMAAPRTRDALAVMVCYETRERTAEALTRFPAERGYDVLLVDDGSSDGTADVLARSGLPFVRHDRNRGLGAAIKT